MGAEIKVPSPNPFLRRDSQGIKLRYESSIVIEKRKKFCQVMGILRVSIVKDIIDEKSLDHCPSDQLVCTNPFQVDIVGLNN